MPLVSIRRLDDDDAVTLVMNDSFLHDDADATFIEVNDDIVVHGVNNLDAIKSCSNIRAISHTPTIIRHRHDDHVRSYPWVMMLVDDRR